METYDSLLKNLEEHLYKHGPNHPYREVYHYSLIPPGKLFRPLLAFNVFNDLTNEAQANKEVESKNSPLSLICSALEIHHAYTLVHDDLPAMDNDDYRRGKESVHKKFGQWKAILAGDGLLNLSYQLMARIKHPNQQALIPFAAWCLGPRGLIQGQVLDLSANKEQGFDEIILIHKLKTARLIQLSIFSGFAFSKEQPLSYDDYKSSLRLGEALGLTFQLLDDLIDMYEDTQVHESEINPWFHFFKQTNDATLFYIKETQRLIEKHQLENTHSFIKKYLNSSVEKFLKVCPEKELNKFDEVLDLLKAIH